jgi:GT2 family glycosyltransferase
MNISVIIPTYKNEFFFKNLEHNLSYISDYEVIIVNDNPSYSLVNKLLNYENIKVIENKKNLGFSGAVNKGAHEATGKYLMLLNDDVTLNDKSFEKATLKFQENKNIFAVSFAQRENSGKIIGSNKIFFKNGFLQHDSDSVEKLKLNAWAEGGACLIDKNKFLELGGFDKNFNPFYWEDIDLSYRAYKLGYEIIFDPSIIVNHNHETTIKSAFKNNYIEKIAYRNQLLCIWKNITDKNMLKNHYYHLFKKAIKSLVKLDFNFLNALLLALIKLPAIVKFRFNSKHKLTDHEILEKFKK